MRIVLSVLAVAAAPALVINNGGGGGGGRPVPPLTPQTTWRTS
jgi:hypothetical protein